MACAMNITIEEVNEGSKMVFFFHGTHPNGLDFCGTADDVITTIDMAKECAEMEWKP